MKTLIITTIALASLTIITYALAANILTGIDREMAADYTPEYSVRIKAGDTVWHIARALNRQHYQGRKDIREIVYNIGKMNPGLNPGALRVGQTLYLPAAYIDAKAVVGIPETYSSVENENG